MALTLPMRTARRRQKTPNMLEVRPRLITQRRKIARARLAEGMVLELIRRPRRSCCWASAVQEAKWRSVGQWPCRYRSRRWVAAPPAVRWNGWSEWFTGSTSDADRIRVFFALQRYDSRRTVSRSEDACADRVLRSQSQQDSMVLDDDHTDALLRPPAREQDPKQPMPKAKAPAPSSAAPEHRDLIAQCDRFQQRHATGARFASSDRDRLAYPLRHEGTLSPSLRNHQ